MAISRSTRMVGSGRIIMKTATISITASTTSCRPPTVASQVLKRLIMAALPAMSGGYAGSHQRVQRRSGSRGRR